MLSWTGNAGCLCTSVAPNLQVVKKGGELLLSEAVKGGGGLLGSTFVDRNWEQFFAGEVRGRLGTDMLDATTQATACM